MMSCFETVVEHKTNPSTAQGFPSSPMGFPGTSQEPSNAPREIPGEPPVRRRRYLHGFVTISRCFSLQARRWKVQTRVARERRGRDALSSRKAGPNEDSSHLALAPRAALAFSICHAFAGFSHSSRFRWLSFTPCPWPLARHSKEPRDSSRDIKVQGSPWDQP